MLDLKTPQPCVCGGGGERPDERIQAEESKSQRGGKTQSKERAQAGVEGLACTWPGRSVLAVLFLTATLGLRVVLQESVCLLGPKGSEFGQYVLT